MQLERRVAFRRAMKKAIESAFRFGAQGIKIRCAGRLNGAEIARSEWYQEGRLPLHTLKADIDYGFAEAQHDLRKDRREGLDLPRRAAQGEEPAGRRRRRNRRGVSHVDADEGQVPQAAARDACGARPIAAATLAFGDMGLQVARAGLDHRAADRGGPHRDDPRTSSAAARSGSGSSRTSRTRRSRAETRMGKGKGAPEGWVAVVKPGTHALRDGRRRLHDRRRKRWSSRPTSSASRRGSSRRQSEMEIR